MSTGENAQKRGRRYRGGIAEIVSQYRAIRAQTLGGCFVESSGGSRATPDHLFFVYWWLAREIIKTNMDLPLCA